jgi:hypothetical protein
MLRYADLPRRRRSREVIGIRETGGGLVPVYRDILNVHVALPRIQPDFVEVRFYDEEVDRRHAADPLVPKIDLELDFLLQNYKGLGSRGQLGGGSRFARRLVVYYSRHFESLEDAKTKDGDTGKRGFQSKTAEIDRSAGLFEARKVGAVHVVMAEIAMLAKKQRKRRSGAGLSRVSASALAEADNLRPASCRVQDEGG